MKGLRLAVALLVIAFAARAARAQSSAGGEVFDFLNLDANARAVGLGGAYTALATDANALLYNPAGLARVKRHEATFMHNQHAQGVGQQYVGAALRQGFGFHLNYATLGSVPRTTISRPDGSGTSLNASDTAVGAGYGKALSPAFSVGAGAKYYHETLADAQANGFGLDLGALYRFPELRRLTLGAALLNAGPDVKFQRSKEKLPTMLRLGAAYSFKLHRNDNLVSVDLTKTRLDKVRLGLGLETVLDKSFALRLGFTTKNDAGIGVTAGLGFARGNIGADYAFAPLGELGSAHRVSVTLRWGQADDPAQAAAAAQPGTPEWHLARAEALLKAGERAAARAELADGLALLSPRDRRRVRFHERQGAVALMDKDLAGALNLYLEGIKLAYDGGWSDQSVADSYVGLGLCLAATRNTEHAVKSFEKALEIGPSPGSLAAARFHLKNLRRAEAAPAAEGGRPRLPGLQ